MPGTLYFRAVAAFFPSVPHIKTGLRGVFRAAPRVPETDGARRGFLSRVTRTAGTRNPNYMYM